MKPFAGTKSWVQTFFSEECNVLPNYLNVSKIAAQSTKDDIAPDLEILETKGFCTHQPQTKVCIRDHCLLSMLDFN